VAVAEGVGGAAAAAAGATEPGRKPPAGVKLFYSVGQVIESGYLTANSFVFFYYTAVLGLSGSLVGAAFAISLILDALADPVIGSWSDSVRSRFGRLLPVMLVGAPLAMLTMGLMFSPPAALAPFLLFLWLTVTKMAVRAFASMYNIPYFALGGEMSDDYAERSRIAAWRLLAGILTSVATIALAYSVFFAGEGGLQRPERYPAFGWTIGAIMLAGGLICCAGVLRYAASLPQPTERPPAMGRRLLGEIAEILRNRSFVILFLSLLLFASAAGVHQALNNHAYVFLWKLQPEKIQILVYVYLFGIFAGTPLTPVLLRWMEKKAAASLGFLLVMGGWISLPGVRALGLYAPTGDEAVAAISVMNFFVGLGTGIAFVAFPAMMADAADEHEHLFGARREGLYFSGITFGGKAAAGVGSLVGGFALDLLRFPREAGRQVNAVVSEDVLAGLAGAWGPLCAFLCLVGALFFLPYGISRARQAEIAAAIRKKRAAA
jgi:glycoside/pentoside/hexuronide:cation symporter, GPH family